MMPEERRARPEHHVVHDYANLVSSGLLRQPKYVALLLQIPTANSHAWHASYTNCRKMYEFFVYDPHPRYFARGGFYWQQTAIYVQVLDGEWCSALYGKPHDARRRRAPRQ